MYATVPAYFNDAEKRATIDIYKVAGYTVERVTSEPVAGSFFVLSQHHLQSSDTRECWSLTRVVGLWISPF